MEIDSKVHDMLNRERPGLLAVIGATSRDGFPHLVPVWYRWDGRAIYVWTLGSRAWVRNVLRDPKVGVSVQDDSGLAVMIKGYASVRTADDAEVHDEIGRITRRYVADEEVQGYIDDWPALRTIVRIEPQRLFVWSGLASDDVQTQSIRVAD